MADGNDLISDTLGGAAAASDPAGGDSLDDAIGTTPEGAVDASNFMKAGIRLTPAQEAGLSDSDRIKYNEKVRREDVAYEQEWNLQGSETASGELWTDQAYSTLEGDEIWDFRGQVPAGESRDKYTPQYSSGYARSRLNSMATPDLVALQMRMFEAGYISEQPTLGGVRSMEMVAAFDQLVTRADSGRNSWETQLNYDIRVAQDYAKNNKDDGPTRPGFTVPDFRKPDYASLAQVAKESVRGQLGRNPSESEMSLLTDYLGQQYRNKWQQNEVAVERSAWEKNGRAAETGEEQGGVTLPQVDPLSRFNEFFEDRYEGELAHRKRVDKTKQNTSNLFGSFDTIARAI